MIRTLQVLTFCTALMFAGSTAAYAQRGRGGQRGGGSSRSYSGRGQSHASPNRGYSAPSQRFSAPSQRFSDRGQRFSERGRGSNGGGNGLSGRQRLSRTWVQRPAQLFQWPQWLRSRCDHDRYRGFNNGRFYSGRGYYYGGSFYARPYFGFGLAIPWGYGYPTDYGCGYFDDFGYFHQAPCYVDPYYY